MKPTRADVQKRFLRNIKARPMTVATIDECLAAIRDSASDDEDAHSMEDDLHQTVLRAIANGSCNDAAACADWALRSLKIKFSRWQA